MKVLITGAKGQLGRGLIATAPSTVDLHPVTRDDCDLADASAIAALIQQVAPDLVIMDIQLPNVSGIDLIAQLKADDDLNGVPVLAVTAYAGKGDEERIRDAGAADYLAKPVSIGPFMTAVRTLLPA